MSAKDNYQCGLLFVALDEGEDPTSISAEGAISGWIDDMHLKSSSRRNRGRVTSLANRCSAIF